MLLLSVLATAKDARIPRRHRSNSNIGDSTRSAIQRHARTVAREAPAEIELKELCPGTSV
jgi:hypothetical protein